MGREILFKAKLLDGGGWIRGDLVHGNCESKIYDGNGVFHLVDYNTVCQLIITDKEYGQIFENDIIEDSVHGKVVRRFVMGNIRNFIQKHIKSYGTAKWKVIGNIHDNKEESE